MISSWDLKVTHRDNIMGHFLLGTSASFVMSVVLSKKILFDLFTNSKSQNETVRAFFDFLKGIGSL